MLSYLLIYKKTQNTLKFSIIIITRGRYYRPFSGRRAEWTQFGLHSPLCEFFRGERTFWICFLYDFLFETFSLWYMSSHTLQVPAETHACLHLLSIIII
jgi:hypothetical protein